MYQLMAFIINVNFKLSILSTVPGLEWFYIFFDKLLSFSTKCNDELKHYNTTFKGKLQNNHMTY